MSLEFQSELEAAKEIALKAGKLIKELSIKPSKIKHKGAVDLVTNADIAAEKLIIEKLSRSFPNHEILSEEAGLNKKKESKYLWVIDPLDGTTNYAHRFPVYCVSIGLLFEGDIVAGVVYDPNREELFSAQLGGGAFLNDKSIKVSKVGKLDNALLSTGFPYSVREEPEPLFSLFKSFALNAQGVRRAGAAALDLCYVACSRFDGFWELGLKPWDMAAACLVVSEAKGKLSTFDDSKFDIFADQVVASNGIIHEEMLQIIKDV